MTWILFLGGWSACTTPSQDDKSEIVETDLIETDLVETDLIETDLIETDPVVDEPGETEEVEESDAPAPPTPPPCPADMADLTTLCIDRTEATLEVMDEGGVWQPAPPWDVVGGRTVRAASGLGLPPQGYISADEAAVACAAAGRRLCTSTEWLLACQGPSGWTWPYGPTEDPGACNTTYPNGHPVVNLFGTANGVWDVPHMNDPRINQQPDTIDPGGSNPRCVTPDGVFDLHGNLHEWVDDADGTFRGGFYVDAVINGAGCLYRTTAHPRTHHDYSTGFRCCADRQPQ